MNLLRWLALVVFLASCQQAPTASGQVAGGSAVEGETLTARLVDSRGVPLALCVVKASSDDVPDWSFQTRTDSLGTVRIPIPSGAKSLILVVELPGPPGQHRIVFRIPLRRALDTTLVQPRWGALRGTVGGEPGWKGLRLRIPALGDESPILEGRYGFDHLPPGRWQVLMDAESLGIGRVFDLGAVDMPIGGADVYRDLRVDLSVIFRMDFEDSAAVFDRSSCIGDPQATFPQVDSAECLQVEGGTGAWDGKSLWVHLEGSPQTPRGMRLSLGLDQALPWARSGDSLRFWAMGTGSFRLVVEVGGNGGIVLRESASQKLSTAWRRYSFPLPDSSLATGDPVSVSAVRWVSDQESWLVVDQLDLAGPSSP